MYEIGDKVVVNGSVGKIVSYHYDEGNVWTVRMLGGQHWDFCESEMSPATDAYGHPWKVSK